MKPIKYEDCDCCEGKCYLEAFKEWIECIDCDYNLTDSEVEEIHYSKYYDNWEARLKGN